MSPFLSSSNSDAPEVCLRCRPGRTWRITAPLLKLCLKYGVCGPWRSPNRSIDFDAYALSRGPSQGIPNVADFCVTMLMNSGIRSSHIDRLSEWISRSETKAQLKSLADVFAKCDGLQNARPDAVELLAKIAQEMIDDTDCLPGIKVARVFKWLSAWAPAHVPMLDNDVCEALCGKGKSAYEYLEKFNAALAENEELLNSLSRQLSVYLGNVLPKPISPVRVLDSLIWFDWTKYHQTDFASYFDVEQCSSAWISSDIDHYQLSEYGEETANKLLKGESIL